MTDRDQEDVKRLTEEFERAWAKTWETEKGGPPTQDELRAHPQYQVTLQAWLEGSRPSGDRSV